MASATLRGRATERNAHPWPLYAHGLAGTAADAGADALPKRVLVSPTRRSVKHWNIPKAELPTVQRGPLGTLNDFPFLSAALNHRDYAHARMPWWVVSLRQICAGLACPPGLYRGTEVLLLRRYYYGVILLLQLLLLLL